MRENVLVLSILVSLFVFSSAIFAVSCGDTITTDTTLTAVDPVVTGACTGTALTVGADSITLNCAGLTLTGDGTGEGIRLHGRSGVTVQDCFVTNFKRGVFLSGSSDTNTLTNIESHGNSGDGILLSNSDGNTIENSYVYSNGRHGIAAASSDTITIKNNRLESNTQWGIIATDSNGYDIHDNTYTGNTDGSLGVNTCGTINEDTILIGDILDHPHTCFKIEAPVELSCKDFNGNIRTIDGDGFGFGVEINADSATVQNCNIKEFNSGVKVNSDSNTISDIQSTSNVKYGIFLKTSSGNTLTQNTLDSNKYGIVLIDSTGNIIHKNDFLNSGTDHASDDTGTNTWFDSVAETGNYWDDHSPTCPDSEPDGICDTAYFLDLFPRAERISEAFPIVLTITSPVTGTTYDADQVLSYITLRGDEAVVEYNTAVGGSRLTITGTNNIPLGLGEGTFTVTVFAKNIDGDEVNDSVTYTVDYPTPVYDEGGSDSGGGYIPPTSVEPETETPVDTETPTETPVETEIPVENEVEAPAPGLFDGITGLITGAPEVSAVTGVVMIIILAGLYKALGASKFFK